MKLTDLICRLQFHKYHPFLSIQYSKTLAFVALVASASAFAPPAPLGARAVTGPLFAAPEMGEFDDKMWNMDNKDVVYASWDPSAPRSTRNFNPYETFGGNACDASGIYPGESFYKDPQRPDMSFAVMMDERARTEAREGKAGDVPGAPGCKN